MGAELIDRRTTPIKLTPEGERFRETAIGVLRDLYRDRDSFRRDISKLHADVWIYGSTSILVHFAPAWIDDMIARIGPFKANMGTYGAYNMGAPTDMVMRLRQREIDLAMTYSHPDMTRYIDTEGFESKLIGTTPFRPYSGVADDGKPVYDLPGRADALVPTLNYAMDSILTRAESLAIERSSAPLHLRSSHQSMAVDMLKNFAVMGRGIAWLPTFAIDLELAAGKLVAIGDASLIIDLEIRLYKASGRSRDVVDKMWKILEKNGAETLHDAKIA